MDSLSPLFGLAGLAIALATALVLNRRHSTATRDRYVSIDGLRGYLAFFVFLHHSALWYFYLRTGRWETPPSRLFAHLGQIGVALFFMITSFLFFSKVLSARLRPIDWTRLYVSRVLRLAPLYFFAMGLLGIAVALLSHFSLHEAPLPLLMGALRWLTFTIVGGPPLNGVAETSNVIAQVTWSLSYEWFFYLALPMLALLVRVVPPVPYILLSLAAVGGFTALRLAPPHLLAFVGGMAAATAVRWPAVTKFCQGPVSAFVAVGCLILAAVVFPVTDRIAVPALGLLIVAFVIVAAGNELWGILRAPCSLHLGEMSYSIYLLHGFLLFLVFRGLIGVERAASLSPLQHWSVVLACSPLLVIICHAAYRFIERPPNRAASAVTLWLESRYMWRRTLRTSPT